MKPAFALILALMPLQATATDVVVNDYTDRTDAACPQTCTLRAAIASAVAGDQILFAGSGNTIVLQQGEIEIGQALSLRGPGANRLTISGNQVSRIFAIDNHQPTTFAVAISDLSFAQGAANGLNGIHPEPPPAEGGAIRIGGSAVVVVRRAEFRDNQAFGGFGAFGEFPQDGSGFPGDPGGDGGDARGGAIANAGALLLDQVLFDGNAVRAGQGGDGGHGASGPNGGNGGIGGAGGRAGDALGGALFSSGTLQVRNVSWRNNQAIGARGGIGGDGGLAGVGGLPADGGDGGDSGIATAGALYVAAGTAELSFVSMHGSQAMAELSGARGGFAGGIGASAGSAGAPGLALASTLSDFGTLSLRHSLLQDESANLPICGPVGNEASAEGVVLASDSSCLGTSMAPLPAEFGALISGSSGVRVLAFPANSPGLDAAANCTTIGGMQIAVDAAGQARPQGAGCEPGAAERDPTQLFRDGFESPSA